MPRKSKSRKKKGAGMFDFLKAGESKSYTNKRCKEYENEITKLEKRIDELKAKQEEYKCLGGDMITDNPMQQSEFEPEPETDINSEPETEPQQVDVEIDSSDDEEEMQPLYPIKKEPDVEGVLGEVPAPEDRNDDIAKTVTGLKGGRRRRRKSRRKSKRKSKKRRKLRKKKSRKRRRRKSRR